MALWATDSRAHMSTMRKREFEKVDWAHKSQYFVLLWNILFIYLAVPGLSCNMWDLFPWPGLSPGPLRLEHGPPGKSHECHYFNFILPWGRDHCQTRNWLSCISCSSFVLCNLHQMKDGGVENSPQQESTVLGGWERSWELLYLHVS